MSGSSGNAGDGPDILWAPWRMEYIESVNRPSGCVFCLAWDGKDDRASLVVHRGESAFVILNRFPYNNGHLMVVPVRHTADLGGLDGREKLELFDLLEASRKALDEAMHPQGYNLGMNLGRTAGAGIADHLHFHLVPRWNGDTNFMPILGHTKVVSEGLEQTRDKLAGAFQHLNGGRR
ncbi:MAG: HIT domain-containing protein [bacterium]|nr:HIT domain-containing protein [bacterium]